MYLRGLGPWICYIAQPVRKTITRLGNGSDGDGCIRYKVVDARARRDNTAVSRALPQDQFNAFFTTVCRTRCKR